MEYSFLLNLGIRTIIAAVVICAAISQARAEYVFKKDGAIIEGKIIVEDGTSITIITLDKKRQTIQLKDIMKMRYTKLYMGKVFIRMTTGETQEGYVIDEDQDNYFVRKDITKPEEITIQRVKVMFIARSNPTDLVGTATQHEITLKWNAPYIPGKKYRVYIKGPKETEFAKPIEISGTSYTISKLKSNSVFRVYITSIDGVGVESLPSEHIEITTLNIPPTTPGDVRKEIVTNFDPKKTGIKLSWEASQDADGTVAEYRIFKQPSEGEELKLGSTKTTDFFIKDADLADTSFVMIVAVDNNGTESDDTKFMIGAAIETKTPYLRVRPMIVYPFGKMGKLYGIGFGTGIGVVTHGYLFRNSQIGIETGYLRWKRKDDDIKGMNMFPAQLSIGIHQSINQRFFVTGAVSAGIVYMSTKYTDAALQSAKKSGLESIATVSISGQYAVSPKIYILGGIEYSAIYEKKGIKSFAGAHLGTGIRL